MGHVWRGERLCNLVHVHGWCSMPAALSKVDFSCDTEALSGRLKAIAFLLFEMRLKISVETESRKSVADLR